MTSIPGNQGRYDYYVTAAHVFPPTKQYTTCIKHCIMSSSYYSGSNSSSIEAIVVDIGAGLTKMGWAGDDYPRGIFRSVCCGYILLLETFSGPSSQNVFLPLFF